ncbi:MAG: hypothetical protein KDK66_01955 [Deltaproteobacteria bacterium]|nr:hypothetical protein [Deltaproteobacteria bacterium]
MQAYKSTTNFEVKWELKRKLLHLPGLLVPFLYAWQPHALLVALALISALYYFSELARLKKGKSFPLLGYLGEKLSRPSSHLDLAPIYLAVGLGISLLFLPFKAALVGTLLVCFCDAVAAVTGIQWGRRRIFVLKKTYLGSFAFFISAFLSLLLLLGWPGALVTALVATLVETFSIEGIDNLLLPILGGLVAQLFL